MSPHLNRRSAGRARFPRVSGDEPQYAAIENNPFAFSPRERG